MVFSGLRALLNVTAHAASMFDVRCVNSQATKTYQEDSGSRLTYRGLCSFVLRFVIFGFWHCAVPEPVGQIHSVTKA